jgi:Berberine and berberine like
METSGGGQNEHRVGAHSVDRYEAIFDRRDVHHNFQTEDEGQDRIEAVHGEALQQLATVKAKWDPENVFRMNRNIIPI